MNKYRFVIFTLLLAFLIVGCGSAAPEQTPPTAAPVDTAIPEPTPIPTPAKPLTILVIPEDMDRQLSDQYQALVYNLAQDAGMRFQVRNRLTLEDLALEPALKVVIALPPDPGLAELVPAAPQAQFLAVNIPGVTAGGNLSALSNASRPDISAFLAGYIAAMITEDYHTGLMVPKDNPVSQTILAAFNNGVEYYCGLCNPWAGPFYDYPIAVEVPGDTPEEQYGAFADYLTRNVVETMYVHPDLATPDLLTYLSSSGTLVISDMTPQKILGNWVASIQPDVIHAIENTWPDLVAGVGGVDVISPLIITNVNEEHLPNGKLQDARNILEQLQSGLISTGVEQP